MENLTKHVDLDNNMRHEFTYKTAGADYISFFNKSGGISFYSRSLDSIIDDFTTDKLRFIYSDEGGNEVEQNGVLLFLTIDKLRYVIMMPEQWARLLHGVLRKCYYNSARIRSEFDSILGFQANLFSSNYGIELDSKNVLLWLNNEKNEFVSTGITVKMEYFKEVEQFSITEFRVQAPKDLQESEFGAFCNKKLHEIAFANRQQFHDNLLTTHQPTKKGKPSELDENQRKAMQSVVTRLKEGKSITTAMNNVVRQGSYSKSGIEKLIRQIRNELYEYDLFKDVDPKRDKYYLTSKK
jgi:hypothetical protein